MLNSVRSLAQCATGFTPLHLVILMHLLIADPRRAVVKVKVKSSMARSLPVENLLPQFVGLIQLTGRYPPPYTGPP